MRLVRSRFGLVAWFAIALLVLLVPAWHLRALRQWEKPAADFNGETTPFGLSSSEEKGVARRYPNDVAAQLAPLRNVDFSDRFKTEERAKADYFARYDALEARFPKSNAVRAQHLRDVTRGPLEIDETPHPKDWNYAEPPQKKWLTDAQLQIAVGSARAAEKIEPDNAFFPWMEAILQFSLKRDGAAVDALQRAGNCARFDDYTGASARARMALLHRLRATGWEDDLAEYGGVLLPHFAKMRAVARAAMGRSRRARARGDEARALETIGALQRAGAVVGRSNSGGVITNLVGQAICAIAWSAAIENLPDKPQLADFLARNQSLISSMAPATSFEQYLKRERESSREASIQYRRALIARYARYMRARGRDDLAREALKIFDDLGALRVFDVSEALDDSPLPPRLQLLTRFYWIGAIALRLALVGAALWLISWPLARLRTRRPLDLSARRAVLVAAMFSAGATAVALAVISRAPTIMLLPSFGQPRIASDVPDPLTVWNQELLWILLALWVGPFLVALLVARSVSSMRALKGALWLALLAGWMRAVSGLIFASIPRQQMPPAPSDALSLPLFVACGALGGWLLWRWARARGLLAPTAIACVLWILAVVYSTQFFSEHTPFFEIVQTLTLALSVSALPFWFWRKRAPKTMDAAGAIPIFAAAPDAPDEPGRARRALAIAGLIAGWSVMWNCLRLPGNVGAQAFWALFGAMLGGVLALACAWRVIRARRDIKLAQVCVIGAALALLILGWITQSAGHGSPLIARTLVSAFLMLPLSSVCLFVGRGNWINHRPAFSRRQFRSLVPRSNFIARVAASAHVAAGALALLSALGYFGLALWSAPAEHQTRAIIARQLQIGEAAWLREQRKSES